MAESEYEGAKSTRPYDWRSAVPDVRYKAMKLGMTKLEKDNEDLRTKFTKLETQLAELKRTQNRTTSKGILRRPTVAWQGDKSEVSSLADTSKVTSAGGTIGTNPATTEA